MIRSVLKGSRRDRRKAIHSRVFLNDMEVTYLCQVADDKVGRVLLIKRGSGGWAYADANGNIAKEWRHGRVRIVPRSITP